jgi:hypothetical protein
MKDTAGHLCAREEYARLADYAALQTKELSEMLRPYVETTDRYGELICRVTLVLGTTPPRSRRDAAMRDLIADVFDFLYEARHLIIKGKLEVAYPLVRRAYESLSLLVACYLDPTLADRWIAGGKIHNAEVRKVLGKHPAGEPEVKTGDLYRFFSEAAHPNRKLVAHRFLGEGNEFVLGAIGRPNLVMLADYALKTLNLWYWFKAFVSFAYLHASAKTDPDFTESLDAVAKMAQEVAPGLSSSLTTCWPRSRRSSGYEPLTRSPIGRPIAPRTPTRDTPVSNGLPADRRR